MSAPAVAEIAGQFALEGSFREALPLTSGHINDTFLVSCGGPRRYILQRINHAVFRKPEQVMENVERVTRYAREQITAAGGDPDRETLTLVPARRGGWSVVTAEGDTWRTYLFIEGARTYEVSDNPLHLLHAAGAFGRFLRMVDSLPGPRLHETIPGFHYTPGRLAAFYKAVEENRAGRLAECRDLVNALLERGEYAPLVTGKLSAGELPERVTHNDTKLNNVLIDDQTGAGLCVLDLDTVMPGSVLYDFGDLIRMGAATAAEDEGDLAKVTLDLGKFEVLARGFLEEVRGVLTPAEVDLLPFVAILITYEQSLRFLGDYLNGDVYYKTHRPGQNLDRARIQVAMTHAMEQSRGEMDAIVTRYR